MLQAFEHCGLRPCRNYTIIWFFMVIFKMIYDNIKIKIVTKSCVGFALKFYSIELLCIRNAKHLTIIIIIF